MHISFGGFILLIKMVHQALLLLFYLMSYSRADTGHSGCGGASLLTRNNGVITSQSPFGSQSQYQSNAHCIWRIHANNGHIVRLSSTTFNLEDDNTCDYDYLAVYDGKSADKKLIGKFCGNATVEAISSHRYLYLEFVTDDSKQGHGFKLTYHFTQASAGCGSHFYRCPNNRCIPHSKLCDGHDDCGDTTDEHSCGATGHCSNHEYECPDSTCIPKKWVCDGSNDCGDYSDEFNCGKQTGLSGCNSSAWQNGTSGSFSSMGFPLKEYDNDTDCHWDINVPDGKYIKLTFDSNYELEEASAVCDKDRITIINGVNHTFIDEFCGADVPPPIIIPSNHGIVRFVADDEYSFTGFRIHWEMIDSAPISTHHDAGPYGCDEWITYSGPGSIQTPGYGPGKNYPSNATCVWRITAPENMILRFHFNSFATEGSTECSFDSVRFFDGPSAGDNLLATMCGWRRPSDFWSKTNEIMVAFFADGSYNNLGFNATYEAVPKKSHHQAHSAACTGSHATTLHATSGSMLSDHYDGVTEYPNNLNCRWKISAPAGKVIELNIWRFETEGDEDCSYDYLRIYDGGSRRSPMLHRLCGFVYPPTVVSSGNSMFLHFVTDEEVGGFGFNITYTIRDPLPSCSTFRCPDESCIPYTKVCDGHNDCTGGTDELVCANANSCGKPAITPATGNTKIVGGREAIPNSLPWQMSLRYLGVHMCGGTLIDPNWVITASHCFEDDRDPASWKVYAGKHHEKKDDPHQQLRQVESVLMHHKYDSELVDFDVTLLKMKTPFTLNDYVSVACLPTRIVPDNTTCIVSGWGDTKGTFGTGLLKQASLPIINQQFCNSSEGLDGEVTENMICAGLKEGGHDTCQGDSGGPLICKLDGKYQLQGITSWGYGCADPNSPGAYTRVINFMNWIHQIIATYN